MGCRRIGQGVGINKAEVQGVGFKSGIVKGMCRLMPNHYSLGSHFYRIGLTDSNHCSCGADYQEINHVVWKCSEKGTARSDFCASLRAQEKPEKEYVRVVLVKLDLYRKLMFVSLKQAFALFTPNLTAHFERVTPRNVTANYNLAI